MKLWLGETIVHNNAKKKLRERSERDEFAQGSRACFSGDLQLLLNALCQSASNRSCLERKNAETCANGTECQCHPSSKNAVHTDGLSSRNSI